ncbi:MAG: hypothetical protein BWY85_00419 [Firmicutes bacterium ADurb.Bin506]|jgi:predicted transcriptional regulator of viral defense system|nr:MAG: hypothetical protein BWY85_00419 [Firmicutes bacterium ADurb.Bin506]
MKHHGQLDLLISANKGIIRTADAVAAGVPRPTFYRFVRERGLERVSHGIYADSHAWTDAMFLLSLRSTQVVFSHETALFLHDLTDREPTYYSVTVKTGYNPSRLRAYGVKVYTVKRELYMIGMSKARTSFGNEVRAYDPERTICDIVRSRNQIEIQTLQDALKQYARRNDKNLRRLMHYAEAFQVDKILNRYLRVLL